jgi:hypothetical protein
VDPALAEAADYRPKAMIDLGEARAFARWRFCRLPRAAEWDYAATQGGATEYPWGEGWVETWANTHGLRLGRVARVGSFESGRSAGGPYDLIGNVAEWTETVEMPVRQTVGAAEKIDVLILGGIDPVAASYGLSCWLPEWSPVPTEWLVQAVTRNRPRIEVLVPPGIDAVAASYGLRCWLPEWSPVPTDWLIQAETSELPRLVLGGSYRTTISRTQRSEWPRFPSPEPWLPGRRGATTGVRLAADPVGLLCALAAQDPAPRGAASRTLLAFLRQPDSRRVLAPAWARTRPGLAPGAMVAWLDDELSR